MVAYDRLLQDNHIAASKSIGKRLHTLSFDAAVRRSVIGLRLDHRTKVQNAPGSGGSRNAALLIGRALSARTMRDRTRTTKKGVVVQASMKRVCLISSRGARGLFGLGRYVFRPWGIAA